MTLKIKNSSGIFILNIFFLFLLHAQLDAQFETVPVEKSKEKVLFQGKIYFLHTVKKGQTLYSICRAYAVNKQDITIANTGIKFDILVEGQVIRIPAAMKMEEVANDKATPGNDDFIFHKVQLKETPYFLHQKYSVPIEDIYKYNPGSEQGLQAGQIVRIPKHSILPNKNKNKEPVSQSENINKYEVKQGDTLYCIAKNYSISVSDLINANEALRWGLKPGQILIIPTNPSVQITSTGTKRDTALSSCEVSYLSKSVCDSISKSGTKNGVKVALLLPFLASETLKLDAISFNDSIDDSDFHSKTTTFKDIIAVEFYEGVLLALDTLKKEGIEVTVFVYDTKADTNLVKKILKELEFIKPDLIIGPFSPEDVRLVSDFSEKTHTPFVPPLIKDDTVVMRNPYLFQIIPSLKTEINVSTDYLSQFYNQNIILLYDPDLVFKEEVNKFKEQLLNKFSSRSVNDSLSFKELHIDDSLRIKLKPSLRNNLVNIVIIVSSSEADISDILTQLQTYGRYYNIEVFGQPSWQKFKNVRIDQFHDLQVTLFSPFFIDYTSAYVKSFINKCRTRLGYEPYKTTSKGTGLNYTFLGYDLGLYFIKAVKNYRKDLCLCAKNNKPQLMLSDYDFERNIRFGCLENRSVNLIRYTKEINIEKIDNISSQ